MDITTTLHLVGDRARLVPSVAPRMAGGWRPGSVTPAHLGSTVGSIVGGVIGQVGRNVPADAVICFDTRPTRHLATRST